MRRFVSNIHHAVKKVKDETYISDRIALFKKRTIQSISFDDYQRERVFTKPVVRQVIEVEKDEIYYFKEWEPTRSASYNTYPYNKEDVGKKSSNKANLLMPTNGETVTLNPVERENSVITFRIFGLLKTGEFSRAKVGTKLADHRAYLRLPADMFHWQDEKNGSSQDATGEASVSSTAKISVLFDCDDFFGSDHGITTAIIKAIEDEQFKNDAFYTLQGVRVAWPTTKGVYIHNGKKVYIK